jgi:hypothetical protein
MRVVVLGTSMMLLAAGPVAGQRAPRSNVVQVTLVARKAATVGVTPVAPAPLAMGLAVEPPAADLPQLAMHWNLPPTLVGSVLLRTARGARTGAAYIERRLLLAEPTATTTCALPSDYALSSDPDAVLAVRMVLF